MRSQSVDIIIAHFSLYTIDTGKRKFIFKEFRRLLKKDGTLILVEPSKEYSAKRIIADSIKLVLCNEGKFISLVKKWFFYPFTYHFGLKFIESQLKRGFGVLLIVRNFAMKSVLMVIQLIRQNKFMQIQPH